MARSQRTSGPPIQLFPFLDVFICTIGSLIVMLMVVSQKVRENTIARAIAETITQPEVIEPAPLALPHVEAAPIAAVPTDDKAAELSAAKLKLEQVEQQARDLDRAVRDRRALLAALAAQSQSVDATITSTIAAERQLKQRIVDASKAQDVDVAELRQLRNDQARLMEKIDKSQKLLAERKRLDGNSAHVIVPYDGVTGTTRRPIVLDCTDAAIRFVAEDIVLTADDLQHFTPSDNPVLAGTRELVRFWSSYNSVQEKPRQQPLPYVLLIVRPSGTLGYYIARGFLEELGTEFGYELVTEDFSFEVPPTEARATELCRAAVEAALKRRSHPIYRKPESFAQALDTDRNSQSAQGAAGASGGPGAPEGAGDKPRATFSSLTESGKRIEKFDSRAVGRGAGTGSQRFFASDSFRDHRERIESNLVAGTDGSEAATSQPGRLPQFAGPSNGTGVSRSDGGRAVKRPEKPDGVADEPSGSEPPLIDLKPPPRERRDAPQQGASAPPRPADSREETIDEQQELSQLMKDREIKNLRSFKRQWGINNPKGTIALEKQMTLRLSERTVVIGDRFKVSRREDRPPNEVVNLSLQAIDVVARDWGKPPELFYWVPSIELVIEPGGDLLAEPMKRSLEQAGVGVKICFE